MEELFVYAILYYEGIIVTEDFYQKRLDSLFLEQPNHEMLLSLEWETDINKAMPYIKTHLNHQNLNLDKLGMVLMPKLKEFYNNCPDIKYFAVKMYSLWQILPGFIQNEEPFSILSYADDPLAWGDEKQSRFLYKGMFHFYEKE